MKKLLLTLALGFAAWNMQAQGVISMNTIGGGANALATIQGTTNRLSGTGFLAQLFWGASGAQMGQLIAVTNAPATFATANFAGYVNTASGGGNRVLPNAPMGTVVTVQIRAWDRLLGDLPPPVSDFANNRPGTGFSQTLMVTLTEPPTGAATLAGLMPYSVILIPEPSIVALGILGGLGVFLLRRRKN